MIRSQRVAFFACAFATAVSPCDGTPAAAQRAPHSCLAKGRACLVDSFDRPAENWLESHAYGRWYVAFTGYGTIGVEQDGGNGMLVEAPKVASAEESNSGKEPTHAPLVLSTDAMGDLDVSVQVKTIEQLRQGAPPNPWETAWVAWHYQDNLHFYYFTLKTNGWELGKEDSRYKGCQRPPLNTGPSPMVTLGCFQTVRIVQRGAVINVWVDGKHVVSFTDTQAPYLDGQLGLYGEDARIAFDDVNANFVPAKGREQTAPLECPNTK